MSTTARAEDCRCLAIAGDLVGAIQGEVARADGLYMRGEYAAALALYAKAHVTAKAPSLLFAQAMATWQLGKAVEAKGLFQAYLAVGGSLAYRDRVELYLRELRDVDAGGVVGVVGGAGGLVGGVAGDATGKLGGVVGVTGGVVGGVTGETLGAVGDVSGSLRTNLDVKPKKLARGPAIVLGVVAVAAIGAVGIHAIAAGIKDDISLDAKFDLGLGLSGVTVGITAIYLNGLTAATGVAAGGLRCETLPKHRPLVAPVAMPGGGGLVTAMSF
ncbi:MAG: hypothetical protein SFX73_19830 [Kofleriaceae bacterium]|nr:hypothetical protein [Kofleriaceae bacterium]